MILERHELSDYIKDNILSFIQRPYNLSYDHFDVYKRDNESVEYRLAFPKTDKLMIFTVYYTNELDKIKLKSLVIGSTIVGQQLISVSFTDDIGKVIRKLENLLFSHNTI